jgi:hypothetical protein
MGADGAAVDANDLAVSRQYCEISPRGRLRYAEQLRKVAHTHATLGAHVREDHGMPLPREHHCFHLLLGSQVRLFV